MLSLFIRNLIEFVRGAFRRAPNLRRRTQFQARPEMLEGRAMMTFVAPVSIPVGSNPGGIAVGDLNGDGRDDMAVVNAAATGSISVLISNGDGTFKPKVDYAAGAGALDAVAGDMNGDGKLDLVVVGASIDVLLGNGDGTFGAATEVAAAATTHSVKVGDFNNDGKLDVGTMNYNSASLLLGNGDGTLQTRSDFNLAGNNINLVVGDYNRDGNLDMAASNTASIGTVSVMRGRGDGSFDAPSSYYAFSAPVYLATGDFNHDGYLDFACPNSYAATSMSVLLNNGDGTYAAPHTYGIAQTGYEIEVADFNNDGNDDFAVRGGSMYMVSLGKGDGSFYPSTTFSTPSGRFEAGTHGDFNGDGAVDLAYPTASGVTLVTNDNASYQNLAGAVTFVVTAPQTTTSGSVLPMTITAVDANGDTAVGFRGAVFISSSDPAASTAAGYAFNPLDAGVSYVFTASDSGTHSFTGLIRLVTGGDQTVTVSAPNMTSASTTVTVTGQVTRLGFSVPTNVSAGDTFDVTVTALESNGIAASGYTSQIRFTSTDGLAGLPADYTFTTADAGSHTFRVTLKTAGAQFVSAKEVGGTITGGATVSVAPQAATSLTLAGGAGAIGVARPITLVARDTFGNIATGYNGTVHFTSSDAAAVLPADVSLVNGTAVANVTFLSVGLQTLTATDVVDGSITGTVSSDATPPVASRFTVEGLADSVAGTSGSFTVSVRDTIGQTATGYRGTVYFSSSDVQAGLPASYTFTDADAGVHTFTAVMRTAGLQSVTVRDAFGALVGTQAGINVSSAAFAQFGLSVPNGADSKGHILVTAGEAISLTVRAVDAFGNSVAGYQGTIAFGSTDVLAGLPANYTFTAADNGVHTFTVDLRTATPNGIVWSFTVVDTADAASLVTKTNFEVVNAAAASFKLSMPTNIDAGVAFDSKVTAVDAYGNTVKNYFGTVHFSSTAALAGLPADYQFDNVDTGVHTFSLALNTSGTQLVSIVDSANAQVVGSETGSVKAGAANAFVVGTSASATAGAAQTLTVSAVDAYGNVSNGYRGTVAFGSSDSQAVLPAKYTFGNNDGGVHAFSITLKTVGVQTVSVVDSADATIGGNSASIAVSSAVTAGSFVVGGFSATTAGVAQSFTVSVKDSFGNAADKYVGTVVFSSSDVQAGLPASYTFTAADRGVHTFSAVLKTAGVQSIGVKDASNAAAVGSQSGIVVTASSTAASMTVAGFPATTAGATQSFTVTMRDAYGNIAVGYAGTVVFSSSDVKASLPASYAFSTADRGVHVFTAVLKTAGLQSITVRDAANAAVQGTQSGISVAAGVAASFRISAPTSVTESSGFKITVTVLDAYGNIATGYRGKIRLSSSDTKAGTTSYSFGSKDNGVATLSYKVSALGLQTLIITDLDNASLVGSVTINVLKK